MINQSGKHNNNFRTGKYVKINSICSFCGKDTKTFIHSKNAFCSRECKAKWESINKRGKNSGRFGIKRPDLVKYNKTRVFSEEIRQKIRDYTIFQHKSGVFNKYDTKPERIFENYLLFNDILYVKQFRYKLGIADFWLPEINTIVEIDGDYWHSRPEVVIRNNKQNKWFEDNNYLLIRIKASELQDKMREIN